MKWGKAVLLSALLLALGASVHSEGDVDEKDVLDLDKSFDPDKLASQFMLVEFFAPWCGFCKKLKPDYASAATQLLKLGIKKETAQLAKIDCTQHKAVCDQNEVQGYPTLKWFTRPVQDPNSPDTPPEKEPPVDFQGARTAEGIVEFVQRRIGPLLQDLADEEEITKFSKKSGVAIVAFLDDESKSTRALLAKAAKALIDDASFGVASASLAKKYSLTVTPGLVAFLSFSDEPVLFEDEISSVEDIVKFVRGESFPPVQEISPENYKSYIDRQLPLVWNFLEKEGREDNIAIIKDAAAASKGRLSWVWLDATDYGRHAENMGLSDKYPGVVIDDSVSKKKFLYPDDSSYDVKSLTQWAAKVLDGSVDPFIKSEPIPEDNSNPLTKVVGKTYDSIVLDGTKDVLLEFYAPWCGHCKQLAPKYDELAEKFKDVSSVVISNVDGTANDVPLDVQGFPTIFFFPAGSKDKPLTYEGERTVQGLTDFILEHSATLSDESKAALRQASPGDAAADESEEEEDASHEL